MGIVIHASCLWYCELIGREPSCVRMAVYMYMYNVVLSGRQRQPLNNGLSTHFTDTLLLYSITMTCQSTEVSSFVRILTCMLKLMGKYIYVLLAYFLQDNHDITKMLIVVWHKGYVPLRERNDIWDKVLPSFTSLKVLSPKIPPEISYLHWIS